VIVFLSIHPPHAEAILAGRKRFEFRRVPPRDADRLLLYATSPVQRVVGHARIKRVLTASPGELWDLCARWSGIPRELFDRYFEGRASASALELASPARLRHPVEVDFLGQFRVPQSYSYLDGIAYGRVVARGNRNAA
jgi:predicted transcriptional regulator